MNSSSRSGSRSIIVIHTAAPRGLGNGGAPGHGRADLARVLFDLALHEDQEEVLLAVEVGVQGAGGVTRAGGDLLHRGAVEAASCEHAAGGVEQALARVGL